MINLSPLGEISSATTKFPLRRTGGYTAGGRNPGRKPPLFAAGRSRPSPAARKTGCSRQIRRHGSGRRLFPAKDGWIEPVPGKGLVLRAWRPARRFAKAVGKSGRTRQKAIGSAGYRFAPARPRRRRCGDPLKKSERRAEAPGRKRVRAVLPFLPKTDPPAPGAEPDGQSRLQPPSFPPESPHIDR